MDEKRKTPVLKRIKNALLVVDSWIDDSLYRAGISFGRRWDKINSVSDRFHVFGWKKWANELACESLTLGLGALIVLLMLALPAFREADDNLLKKADLAVAFLDRYGNPVGQRGIRQNDSVPLDAYPDHMIKALLATEDRRFFEHFGIDVIGTARAVVSNARGGGSVQGGSSLTQQLAKNLFLTNERTLERKIKEAFLALWLEAHLTKKEILKLYLDRAYMGGGAFGAEAAADYYFGKSIRDVTLAEAAMLAGLFKAPSKYAPHANLPAARARASTVLDNLVDAGFMTEGQVFGARRNPATPIARKSNETADYYLDYAFDDVKRFMAAHPEIKERTLLVRTGLDQTIQRAADKAVETVLAQFGKSYGAEQASVVTMDLDGVVRAIVGGRDYGESQFNRATDAMRQPGSSFKPIVYATAMDEGLINSKSIIVDAPICLGNWCPNNYGRSYAGSMTATIALVKSINTVPVRLTQMLGKGDSSVGRPKVIAMAKKLGIKKPLTNSAPLPIGAAEIALVELTTAYGSIGNGGRGLTPTAIMDVRTSAGDVIWSREKDAPKPLQVLKPAVAADLAGMMVQVVENGTGKRAIVPGVQIGGKTGTTNAYKDALFVGYSGYYATGVWFGNDDSTPTHSMTGGSLPAMTFQLVMNAAHQGLDPKPVFGQTIAQRGPVSASADAPAERPQTLSKRTMQVLDGINKLFDALQAETPPPGPVTAAPAASARTGG